MEQDLVAASERLGLLGELIAAAQDQRRPEIAQWLFEAFRLQHHALAALLKDAAVRIALLPAVPPNAAPERLRLANAFGRAKAVLAIAGSVRDEFAIQP